LRELPASLTDDLEAVDHPDLRAFVGVECCACGPIALDASDRVENVEQTGTIGSHAVLNSNRFAENLRTDSRTQSSLRYQFHSASQQILQVHRQAAEVEQAST
jgi:hypothetical protein